MTTASKRTALDAHREHTANAINDLEASLATLRARHQLTKPNWCDVGDAAHYAEQAKEIADRLLKRGEYAPEED